MSTETLSTTGSHEHFLLRRLKSYGPPTHEEVVSALEAALLGNDPNAVCQILHDQGKWIAADCWVDPCAMQLARHIVGLAGTNPFADSLDGELDEAIFVARTKVISKARHVVAEMFKAMEKEYFNRCEEDLSPTLFADLLVYLKSGRHFWYEDHHHSAKWKHFHAEPAAAKLLGLIAQRFDTYANPETRDALAAALVYARLYESIAKWRVWQAVPHLILYIASGGDWPFHEVWLRDREINPFTEIKRVAAGDDFSLLKKGMGSNPTMGDNSRLDRILPAYPPFLINVERWRDEWASAHRIVPT